MAIKLDCPRCKKPLSIPRKKIGRYVNCPRCSGRFWVPENAVEGAPEVEPDIPPSGGTAGSAPVAPAPQPPQPPEKLPVTVSMGGAATMPPGGVVPETPAGQNTSATQDAAPRAPPRSGGRPPVEGGESGWQVVPPAPPATGPAPAVQPPRTGQKTARFISAEAAQSTLKLEEDGRLPELHLREGEQKEKKETKTTTVNPLVLFGLLAISVALSIGLALVDLEPPESQTKDQARRTIEENFFPREGQEPLQYQEYLMEAQRAATRGNRQAQRELYGEVLDLLRQETPEYIRRLPKNSPEYKEEEKKRSVTGTWTRDKELEDLISTLLSND